MRLPLALVAALVLTALAPVPAAAAPAHSSRHVALAKAASRAGAGAAAATSTQLLTYGGGPVGLRPRVYLVFWGTEWTDGTFSNASTLEAYVHDFFAAIGGSAWLGSTGEYCQGVTVGATSCPFGWAPVPNPPGQLGGVWIDSTAVPPTPIDSPDDSAIWMAVQRAYVHFNDAHAAYMVFTPPKHDPSNFGTGTNAICAWHDANPNAGPAPYALIPYLPDASTPTNPNSCGTNLVNGVNGFYDGFSIMAGHEYAEILTNPFPNSSSVAWVDSMGMENADKCLWSTSSPATDQPFGGRQFPVQSLWSNAAAGCVYDNAHAPVVGAGRGYTILTGFGGIYSFGDAHYWGNLIDHGYPGQAVSLTEMPDGGGYSILTAPGGIYSFGDASYHGNLIDHNYPGPAVSLSETPDGGGYALLTGFGGIYTFGNSQYFGNLLDHNLGGTPVALAYTPTGLGYYILTAQGGIYTFGDAIYKGNLIDHGYLGQAIGLAVTKDGLGYSILTTSGAVYSFGDAVYLGNLLDHGYPGPAVAVSVTP